MSRFAAAVGFLRAVAREAKENQITFLAAAVAYYGFVSLIPLLLLALAIGSAVGVVDVGEQVVALVGTLLTAEGEAAVMNALENSAGRTGATVVSLAVLAWSGLKAFRGLDVAFSAVYGTTASTSLPDQIRDGVVVVGAIVLGVVAATVVGAVVGFFVPGGLVHVVAYGLLVVTLAFVLFPVFYVFPDAELDPREAVPGTLLAAVVWTALTFVFETYAPLAGRYQAYGILGAALLLVTTLYVGGTIIMVGAVINAVLAGRTDDADGSDDVSAPESAPDITEVAGEVRALRSELDAKTVSRDDLESDLQSYVRRRMRRNHARGWGPYLVLLYGTAMTLGGFYFLDGGWAILAMVVIWLSTLGLYTLMLVFGVGLNAAGVPGRVLDWVRERRT